MSWSASLRRALDAPVDAAGLHAFRIAFGLLLCAGAIRFAARGWIASIYIEPGSTSTTGASDGSSPCPPPAWSPQPWILPAPPRR